MAAEIPSDLLHAPHWLVRAYVSGANRAAMSGSDTDSELEAAGRVSVIEAWNKQGSGRVVPEFAASDRLRKSFLDVTWLKNCGIAAGGFQAGNTCAAGGGGSAEPKEYSALRSIASTGSDAASVAATAKAVFGVGVSMSGKALSTDSLDSIARSRGLPNGLDDLTSDMKKKLVSIKSAKLQMEKLALRREVIARKNVQFTSDVLSKETPPPPVLSGNDAKAVRPVSKTVFQKSTGATLRYHGYETNSHDPDVNEANKARLKHSVESFSGEFERLSSKHPGLKNIGVEVEVVNGVSVKNPTTGSLIHGYYDRKTSKVVVAAGYQKVVTAPLTIGSSKVDVSMTGVLRHEVGHRVQHSLPAETQKKWDAISVAVDWSKVSGYAVNTGKQSELFAESYSAFTHKDYAAGMLPKAIESFMSDLIGA